jgi:hypothetical protein
MFTRTRLALEQLELRQLPSVFITPARIPLQSILHPGGARAQGDAGGAITVHVTAADPLRTASALTERVSLPDQNGVTIGTLQPLTGVRVASAKNGALLVQVSRSALKTALQTELSSGGKNFQDLTGNTTVHVTLSNGPGAGGTAETASVTLFVHPAHTNPPGSPHPINPPTGTPPMSSPSKFHDGDLVSIVGKTPYAGLVGRVVRVTVADGVETDYVVLVRPVPSPTPSPFGPGPGPLAFSPSQLVRANTLPS